MRKLSSLLVLALAAGCTLDPTSALNSAIKPVTSASKAPAKTGASASPSIAPSTTPSVPAATTNGVPQVGITYEGMTATLDGQACKFSTHADRVYYAGSGLITLGAIRGKLTLDTGEHQVQLSVNGNGKSPHVDGFTTADLKDIGWTIWIGDGKYIPNKFAPTGTPELEEKSVENGLLNMRYKGKVKSMLGATEHTMELTIKDFPLR